MESLKNIKIKSVITSLLVFLFYFNLSAQENPNDSIDKTSSNSDFPGIVSSDCDSGKADCNGTIIWEDGSRYEGEFVHGKIHGQGKLTFADNSSYEGEFKEDTFHGTGTMVYEDGSKYIGDWVMGYREGEGVFLFSDGREYIGAFVMDQIHGEGAIVLNSGEVYSGSWEYGQIQGYGTITRLDYSKYIGMNQNGFRHGAGMVVWESGDTLHGNWQDGKMIEEGIFQFADGSTMISYWENGIMLEENLYIKPDGEQYAISAGDLASQIIQYNWIDTETVERNFGLAFYAIGMEYKTNKDFDRAKEHLQYAALFDAPNDNSFIKDMVESQMANIDSEEKNNTGVAKKAVDKDH